MEYDFAEAVISDAQNIYQAFLNSNRSSINYGEFRNAIKNIMLELDNQCSDIVKYDCEGVINCDYSIYKDNIIASLNQILDDGMFVYSLTQDFGGW